ncbi:MAG TPA: PEP/pyruvate-binding domain-containing protein, partial [Actinomycetes bacterium]|nr:PEP/pyruvate-binding domain-containing protein [Actinomycetes bacterium]
MSFVRWLDGYDPAERASLGGKNASLGELLAAGLPVPPGFAVTVDAYHTVRGHPEVRQAVTGLLGEVDLGDPAALEELSAAIRRRIEAVPLDGAVAAAVRSAYAELCERCASEALPVAVRSSATAEDLPDASFAGEHDTYLWVRGPDEVLAHL